MARSPSHTKTVMEVRKFNQCVFKLPNHSLMVADMAQEAAMLPGTQSTVGLSDEL